jgi:hypothetical protein
MNDPSSTPEKKSALIQSLREGIAVVQMILFKEIRQRITKKYPNEDASYHGMLSGALINEIFASSNPEEKFQKFRKKNWAIIEQELLSLPEEHPNLLPILTDALRVQTLCDHQEGGEDSQVLVKAESLGLLQKQREIPLPSTFMTRIRILGEQHGLTIAPVQISPEDDKIH